MKKVIKFTESFEDRRRMMEVISKYTPQLVQDPYGNYVLQESLDNWHDTDPELHDDNDKCFFADVFKSIEGKIEKLAIQKFSSNVVEKCLERANEHYRRIFIREIIQGEPVAIMKNSYGNYVFQKALALAKGIDKFVIIDVIFRNFPTIQDQKIKMKWIKLLKKNLRQEDVLEAEEEQDTLNLDIDQLINYSHKFKLINDELLRYDSSANKKDKAKSAKKKPVQTQEQSYAKAYHPGIHGSYAPQYPGPPMGHAMQYMGTEGYTPLNYGGGKIPGSTYENQYPMSYQTPHTIPSHPLPEYGGNGQYVDPMSYNYGYPAQPQNYAGLTNAKESKPSHAGYYKSSGSHGMGAGYSGSGYEK